MHAEASEKTFEPQREDRPSHSESLRKVLQTGQKSVKDVSFLVDHPSKSRRRNMNAYDILFKSCPKRNGLPLRNNLVNTKLKPNRIEYHQVFHKTVADPDFELRRGPGFISLA